MKKLIALMLAILLAAIPMLSLAGMQSITDENDGTNAAEAVELIEDKNGEHVSTGLTRTVTTVTADEAGCLTAFGEQDGAKWAELLGKLCITAYMKGNNVHAVTTLGSALVTDDVLVQKDDAIWYRSNLISRPFMLKTEDMATLTGSDAPDGQEALDMDPTVMLGLLGGLLNSGAEFMGDLGDFFSQGQSMLRDDADLMQLVLDLMSVKWSIGNTTGQLLSMMNSISIRMVNGWREMGLDLAPDQVAALINALADDMLASDGLDQVVVTYLTVDDFAAWVQELRTTGLDFATGLLKSNLQITYRAQNFAPGQGLDFSAVLEINGKPMAIKLNSAIGLTKADVDLSITDADTGAGECFSLHGDRDRASLTAEWLELTCVNNLLSSEKKFFLGVTDSLISLWLNGEEVCSLTWSFEDWTLTAKGTLKGEPLDLAFSMKDGALSLSFTCQGDTLTVTGSWLNDDQSVLKLAVSLNGTHVFDLLTTVTGDCTEEVDFDALLGDVSDPWNVKSLAGSETDLHAVTDELVESLKALWERVKDEVPAGLMSDLLD